MYIQFLSSWWWAGKPPETCRALTAIKNIVLCCILLVIISIWGGTSTWSSPLHPLNGWTPRTVWMLWRIDTIGISLAPAGNHTMFPLPSSPQNGCSNDWNSLWIKPTDTLNSNFIGITTLHVSGSLSAHHQEFLAVHRHWYILCGFEDRCYQFDDRLLPGAHRCAGSSHQTGSTGLQNRIKCTKADVRLRTPDDGQKGCPKHVEA